MGTTNENKGIVPRETFFGMPKKGNAGIKALEQMVLTLTGQPQNLAHMDLPWKREPRLNSWKVKEIYILRSENLTQRQIAAELDISASYVCRVLAHGSVERALQDSCLDSKD